MVSYMDENVKNNSSKYFGRWLLSVGHGGRWWLATWTTVATYRSTWESCSLRCRPCNVKNNSSKYFGRWLLSVGHGGRWWLATWTTM